MDSGIVKSDKIEKELIKELNSIYKEAYDKSLKEYKEFIVELKKLDEVYKDTKDESVLLKKELAQRKLIKKYKVVEGISKDMANTGKIAEGIIKNSMVDVYGINQKYTGDYIKEIIPNASFTVYDKNQIKVLLNDEIPPFSELAYKNLGNNKIVIKKLSNQLAQATILGESQLKIIKRIQSVTGQSNYQARRVAQTERNRIQSQARYDTMGEADKMGIKTKKKWSARMFHTRETHAMLNNTVVDYNETFNTVNGNKLRFPGDPTAPPEETINCFCVMIPIVEKRK